MIRTEQRLKARNRYTPREFEVACRELDDGMQLVMVCGRLGIARSTFYRWKARFIADVDVQQWLADENRRLRRRVRSLAADKAMLQYILRQRD